MTRFPCTHCRRWEQASGALSAFLGWCSCNIRIAAVVLKNAVDMMVGEAAVNGYLHGHLPPALLEQ